MSYTFEEDGRLRVSGKGLAAMVVEYYVPTEFGFTNESGRTKFYPLAELRSIRDAKYCPQLEKHGEAIEPKFPETIRKVGFGYNPHLDLFLQRLGGEVETLQEDDWLALRYTSRLCSKTLFISSRNGRNGLLDKAEADALFEAHRPGALAIPES